MKKGRQRTKKGHELVLQKELGKDPGGEPENGDEFLTSGFSVSKPRGRLKPSGGLFFPGFFSLLHREKFSVYEFTGVDTKHQNNRNTQDTKLHLSLKLQHVLK